MKSILRAAAASAAIASVAFAPAASAATSDSANVTAEILTALSVTVDPTADTLNFGSIADGGIVGAETVTVDPTTAIVSACTGGLVCTGATASPSFDVIGVANDTVQVTFLNPSETLTTLAPVAVGQIGTLSAGSFTTSAPANIVTLNGVGSGSFDVGGTLTVSPNQAAGVYNGTLTVQVAYN